MDKAIAAMNHAHYDVAIQILTEAIKFNGKDSQLWQKRGDCFWQIRQTYQACQDFSKALALAARIQRFTGNEQTHILHCTTLTIVCKI